MVQYQPMELLVSVVSFMTLIVSSWQVGSSTSNPIVVEQQEVPAPTTSVIKPPVEYTIPQQIQVNQTFNNCGPASLSMLLSYQNKNISQELLGQKLRPHQNPQGNNDDKSVTMEELAAEATNHNLLAYHRPHGSLELLKTLIANDIPVLVRTWLHPNEDIGHYRIVRGYSDITQEIIQDDSYEGGNLRQSYDLFKEIWQPFNYEYLIIVSPEKKTLIQQILASDINQKTAWVNAYEVAEREITNDPTNPYPVFNQSVALFHLGKYEQSRSKYEQIASSLPRRMLWYQIEPIETYLHTNDYEKVFALTEDILSNDNQAFSELYLLRAKAYQEQNSIDKAREEIYKAIFYNNKLQAAQDALVQLNSSQPL